MTDDNIDRPVLRVADLVTGDDRADGRALLVRIRTAIADHGYVTISFADVSTLTPTFVNEGMGPLLDDVPAEILRQQILLVDATRSMADVISAAMRQAQQDRAPLYLDTSVSMETDRPGLMSDATLDRLFGDRPSHGITVIRCERDRLDMLDDLHMIAGPLPAHGFDYRSVNEQWSQGRGRRHRRR